MSSITAATFAVWYRKFENSTRGREALGRLDQEFPKGNADEPVSVFGTSLRNTVLRACFFAIRFKPETDPDHRSRRANWEAFKQLRSQQKAIRRVRQFFAKHQHAATYAIMHAYVDLQNDGIDISTSNEKYRLITERFDRVLAALSARITDPKPFAACGAYRDQNSYGCLVYDYPLDIAKRKSQANGATEPTKSRAVILPRDGKTMLMFDLVQSFRLNSQGIHSRKYRERMPKTGNSRYPLTTVLLNATFPSPRMTTKAAKKRLHKFLKANQDFVGYCDWPVFREWNERLSELEGDEPFLSEERKERASELEPEWVGALSVSE